MILETPKNCNTEAGKHKISHSADLVTSHVIAGYQSLDCFMNSGVIAILSMSSKGALTDQNYRTEALKIIETHPNIVGCVVQNKVPENVLLFTPGVNMVQGDSKGEQYNTPEHVFKNLHTDFGKLQERNWQNQHVENSAKLYQLILERLS